MGLRKRIMAENLKANKAKKYFAKLNNCPTSPRKMRLVCDLIRGKEVNKAIDILRFCPKEASIRVEKLLLSAISNWQNKNSVEKLENSTMIVKQVYVDSGRVLKRLQPAPQGRAHRIKKRSNHVTIVIDSMKTQENQIL